MKNIIAASILAVGLIVAAFLHSGRYYVLVLEQGVAVRVDRWTGSTKIINSDDEWWTVATSSTGSNRRPSKEAKQAAENALKAVDNSE
jgi:hypothetical protein